MAFTEMIIREATPADCNALIELALASLGDTPYKQSGIDAARLVKRIEWALTAPDIGRWVAMKHDTICAALALLLLPQWLTGDLQATHIWYWVSPAARNGTGVRLLRIGEAWAAKHGATAVNLQTFEPHEKLPQFYEHMGYHKFESMYQKELR